MTNDNLTPMQRFAVEHYDADPADFRPETCDFQIVSENAGLAAADATTDRDERIEYRDAYMSRHGAGLTPCGKCDVCSPPPAPWDR